MGEARWKNLQVDDGGRVLRIELDAGRGNVITRGVLSELRDVLAVHADEGKLCAILFDHSGEHFSFGASVEEHRAEHVRELLSNFRLFARDLLGSGVPLVCAVRGWCLGGGLELACLCDRVVASPTARFGQPEIRLGVFAPLGSLLLPRIVGPRRALELLQTGRDVSAQEALALGLVSEVADDPTADARTWIERNLAPKSASSLRHTTRAARATWTEPFLAELEALERDYLERLMLTHDAREGLEAFLGKRAPRWEHR